VEKMKLPESEARTAGFLSLMIRKASLPACTVPTTKG